MTLTERYHTVKNQLPAEVRLVAVSKTYPAEDVKTLYEAGHRHFGENRVQELTDKAAVLPNDIHWHLIGHLQTNKVKYVAPFISMIESADSEKLLSEISRQALKVSREITVLLQIKIAKEESKFGMDTAEAAAILQNSREGEDPSVRIAGVMGMATLSDDVEIIRAEFRRLKSFYDQYREEFYFDTISMGMSGDYPIAVEEGSTSVRIGSLIFGNRA